MNYNSEIVSENLKNIRIRKGWSQEFVARQLGVCQRTISRAECGEQVSKNTLKALCNMYQISMAELFGRRESVYEKKTKEMVSEDDVLKLLYRGGFIKDLEHEIVLRYSDKVQSEALMMREDIEQIIPEALSDKKMYTLADVITACMAVNQKTLFKVRSVAIA